jgi:hypothetical protein
MVVVGEEEGVGGEDVGASGGVVEGDSACRIRILWVKEVSMWMSRSYVVLGGWEGCIVRGVEYSSLVIYIRVEVRSCYYGMCEVSLNPLFCLHRPLQTRSAETFYTLLM